MDWGLRREVSKTGDGRKVLCCLLGLGPPHLPHVVQLSRPLLGAKPILQDVYSLPLCHGCTSRLRADHRESPKPGILTYERFDRMLSSRGWPAAESYSGQRSIKLLLSCLFVSGS